MRLSGFMILFFICFSLISHAADKLIYGVNPYKTPKEIEALQAELIHYLEQKLGMEVVLVVSKDYDHLITLIEQGNVDIASISPKLFAKLRAKDTTNRYLATFQFYNREQKRGSYNGLILTKANSTIHTIADLKGKNFGFTDPDSTSGYFYPTLLMQQNGIVPKHDLSKVYMLKKHSKVIHALLENSIDAGAVYDGVYWSLSEAERQQLRIIAMTEEIPYDAMIASKHLSPTLTQKIHDLLLTFHSDTTVGDGIVGFEEKPLFLYDRLNSLH